METGSRRCYGVYARRFDLVIIHKLPKKLSLVREKSLLQSFIDRTKLLHVLADVVSSLGLDRLVKYDVL